MVGQIREKGDGVDRLFKNTCWPATSLMPVRLKFLETVSRPSGHWQTDAVDIARRRIVRLLGRRHAELGGGDVQGAHVRPAKAATGGAWHRHWQGLEQHAMAVVLEHATAVELADPQVTLDIQRQAVWPAKFSRCLGEHQYLFQAVSVRRITGAIEGTGH